MVKRLIRRTTAEQVAEAVEVSVITGEFDRGSRLPPERKLAAMLGVCRLTLREGLNRLVAKGLLVSVPGLGTFVSSVQTAYSLESFSGVYLAEQARERKIQIVRHYLELRRFAFSTVLSLACQRATPSNMGWIRDAVMQISASAVYEGVGPAAEQELRAIQAAAERADAYGFWLLLNHLRDFFRIARADLTASTTREAYSEHGQRLLQLLEQRDAEGIAKYFDKEVAAADSALLMALEKRARQGAKAPANGVVAAIAGPRPPADTQAQSDAHIAQADATNAPSGALPDGRDACCHVSVGEPLVTPPPQPEKDRPAPGGPRAGPRCDPASWHPAYVDWFRATFGCDPWDDPTEEPPGIDFSTLE